MKVKFVITALFDASKAETTFLTRPRVLIKEIDANLFFDILQHGEFYRGANYSIFTGRCVETFYDKKRGVRVIKGCTKCFDIPDDKWDILNGPHQ